MKLSGRQKIRIAVTIVLFLLFVIANFYTVRALGRYGAELYLYDKMLVAYEFAGMNGLKQELSTILSHDKMPHELAAAGNFEKNLAEIKDPYKFLTDKVSERKNKINFLRNLRSVAFIFILAMLLLRIAIDRRSERKPYTF
ncbi:MAG: hypothetical protein PHP17_02730 [Candidatus Omnitrophica bacterium]|nr:hypothetical protein [Candidatus Omnitrophota bacterium]